LDHSDCSLSIVIDSDRAVHRLNKKYRSVNTSTDVLSFAYDEVDPDTNTRYLGDVIISGDKVFQQASQAGHPPNQELCILVVHGIMHLCGYDHEKSADAKKMFSLQDSLVRSILVSHKNNGLRSSFGNATQGFLTALQSEKNLKFHFAAGLLVLMASYFLHISTTEWGLVILTIAAVIVSELFNTAIETTVDLASPERNDLAKKAKDISAAAVLTIAFASIVIGLVIFLPKILNLLGFSF
jgi:rRNA maturation RNase YbeY